MPNYSGYFAQLKGERWAKLRTSHSGLNIADVSFSLPDSEKLDKLIEDTLKKCPSSTARKWASIGFEAGVKVFIGNES